MKICIVGNGSTALNNKNGKFIDSCDVVVRVKNFKINGYEHYVGTKTDMFSSKWFSWFDRKTNVPLHFPFMSTVNTLFFMFLNQDETENNFSENCYVNLYKKLQLKNELPYPLSTWNDHKSLLDKFKLNEKTIIYFSQEDVEELCCNILNLDKIEYTVRKRTSTALIEPTCGIRTIFKIIKTFPQHEIFLTGFDGFLTSWYWDLNHKINSNHHYLTERMYLKQLIKTKRVVSLDCV